ncbi:unnamed protein product, partial [Didymodactylos carnosus]
MYTSQAPIAAAPAQKSRNAVWPLLAICCLALVGLVVAAIIVLALIPVYLPKRGENINGRETQLGLANGSLTVKSITSVGNAGRRKRLLTFISISFGGLPPVGPGGGTVRTIETSTVTSSNGNGNGGSTM